MDNAAIPQLGHAFLAPPLVSFVVINWNYARFVGDALKSIAEQDYPHFECLVINNGSTDESQEVIARCTEGDARFVTHDLTENLGQLGAAMWALDRINGSYVVFVDADDFLFPNFTSIHLQAHLAFSRSVGLTTTPIVEVDAQRRIIQVRDYERRIADNATERGIRTNGDPVRLSTISEKAYQSLNSQAALVPSTKAGWIWSPGTANMFRRPLLELVRMGDGKQKMLRPADGHFNRLCHALGGTGIVNIPVSAYRIHGDNAYAAHAATEGIRSGKLEDQWLGKSHTNDSIRFLLQQKSLLVSRVGARYMEILAYLIRSTGAVNQDTALQQLVIEHAAELQKLLGSRTLRKGLVKMFGKRKGLEILYRAGIFRISDLRL